ncbi:hypothetical protein TWF694_008041 [Orbilia ellipsospora]|uniref:Aquaporin-like protein n=1 Tax=Orbilia ellipsospora TaxID=2528407 RepID=A0AAV9XFB9_9PEZI
MVFSSRNSGWVERDVRIKGLGWMNIELKNEFVAAIGEYVGTVLFLFFAFAGTQVANVPAAAVVNYQPAAANILYIALSFGFSLAVNAWVFYRISGSLFNPAVTLAMVLAGAISWKRHAQPTLSLSPRN